MASEDLFEKELTEEIPDNFDDEPAHEAERDDPTGDGQSLDADEQTTNGDVGEKSDKGGGQELKLLQLPLTRIRNIMKLDPEVTMASNEAVFLVARATEYFIESLAREAYSHTTQSKKKTVQKRDVDLAISSVDSLMFLDGAMS